MFEADVTGTDPILGDVIGQQLGRLSSWACLPGGIAADLSGALELFAGDALARSAREPFDGLSFVNANGLPVQWSFSTPGERTVRVLCEAGVPATSAEVRADESVGRLRTIVGRLGWTQPAWLHDVLSIVMPDEGNWPSHWRSAIWLGLGASARGIALKPYFNLNRDAPRDRWIRIGQVLVALGRPVAAARLCEMATSASRDSWPVGLAFDLLPDGNPGRVKAYFRSGCVDRSWISRWLVAADGEAHRPDLTRVLDAFTAPSGYPERAFVVSPEFHPDQRVSFKVDLAVTRWIAESGTVRDGLAALASELGMDISSVGEGIRALEGIGLETEPKYRFIGWGIEPDGRTHLNTYVEPPLPVSIPAVRTRNRVRTDPARRAVTLGSEALFDLQADGHWRDYRLPVGASDSWVTAFVLYWSGAQIHSAQAIDWLESSRTTGAGWGFARQVENDADSTALAIIGLRRAGRQIPRDALAFLRACLVPSGGVATFPVTWSDHGAWTSANAEITPVVMAALGRSRQRELGLARRYMDGAHQASGPGWPSYWWQTELYAALLAVTYRYASEAQLAQVRSYLSSVEPAGPFETALSLRIALSLGAVPPAARLAARLIEEQASDGRWRGSAALRLPDPRSAVANAATAQIYLDETGVVTTAMAVGALDLAGR